MRKTLTPLLLALLALSFRTTIFADQPPQLLAPGETASVTCYPLAHCIIRFPGQEPPLEYASSDTDRWILEVLHPPGATLYVVKPLTPGLDARLTVTTNAGIYNFLLHAPTDDLFGTPTDIRVGAPRLLGKTPAAPSSFTSAQPNYRWRTRYRHLDVTATVYDDAQNTICVFPQPPPTIPLAYTRDTDKQPWRPALDQLYDGQLNRLIVPSVPSQLLVVFSDGEPITTKSLRKRPAILSRRHDFERR